MIKKKPAAPDWSGRVSKQKIVQLYQDDADGMHDEELINEVAFTLLARCKSMLVVEAARSGQAQCPVCETMIQHEAKKGSSLECPNCDWCGAWDDYRGSMEGLHLIAPGLQPFCREYVRVLPLARTLEEKVFWIDWLIHRCHWEGTALPGQAGAVCLIQGRAQDVNEFLTNLSAGRKSVGSDRDFGRYWSAEEHERIQKWQKRSVSKRRGNVNENKDSS